MGTRAGKQAGFTLLELLVVLSIIVIAVALIVPNLSVAENSAFNAEVRRAAATLNYVRRVAIVQGAPRVAAFDVLDPASADYDERLEALNEADADAGWNSESLRLRYQGDPNQDPEDVDHLDVTFFPQGGSTGGILSFVRDERSAMIRVDSITGRITTAYNGEDFDEEP